MKLHYYKFPEGVADAIRAEHGCDKTSGCALNMELDLSAANWKCELGFCYECEHICTKEIDDTLSGISITTAKELLKKYGGSAWTCHIDRDGGCFETSEIKLDGNNSRHKYNKHL